MICFLVSLYLPSASSIMIWRLGSLDSLLLSWSRDASLSQNMRSLRFASVTCWGSQMIPANQKGFSKSAEQSTANAAVAPLCCGGRTFSALWLRGPSTGTAMMKESSSSGISFHLVRFSFRVIKLVSVIPASHLRKSRRNMI